MNTLRRLVGFLTGDMSAAEDIGDVPTVERVPWIDRAGSDANDAVATYALEAAIRSATDSRANVEGIQDRAASLLTLMIGLVPLLIAAVGLAAPRGDDVLFRTLAALLYLGASIMLIAAIVMAALATGLTLGGGLNLERLSPATEKPAKEALKAAEADAWHHASILAMEAATRKARDLFHARRFMLWAVVLSIAGTGILIGSVEGNLGQLTSPASPPTHDQHCQSESTFIEGRGRADAKERCSDDD